MTPAVLVERRPSCFVREQRPLIGASAGRAVSRVVPDTAMKLALIGTHLVAEDDQFDAFVRVSAERRHERENSAQPDEDERRPPADADQKRR